MRIKSVRGSVEIALIGICKMEKREVGQKSV